MHCWNASACPVTHDVGLAKPKTESRDILLTVGGEIIITVCGRLEHTRRGEIMKKTIESATHHYISLLATWIALVLSITTVAAGGQTNLTEKTLVAWVEPVILSSGPLCPQ